MTTYKTTINSMLTVNNPDPGYVTNVLFTVSGVSGGYTASIDSSIQFSQKNDSDNFIPYSELTEAKVISWINEATNNQVNYYANIDGQINSMANPPVSPSLQGLPWVAL